MRHGSPPAIPTPCLLPQVLLSLVFAYGVYVLIFNLPFFPFLNLTGLYICVGIGADDIFVFLSAYDEVFRRYLVLRCLC